MNQNYHYIIDIVPRTLHFKHPAGTSRGIYRIRNIFYLFLRSREEPGRVGIGECAPLPALSCDYISNYENVLYHACRRFETQRRIDIDKLRNYPSILFGLETALAHYEAGSFSLYDTPFSKGEAGIPINGLIWMGNYDDMLEQIEKKMADGFRCIKLKIGAINFEEEIQLLQHIRQQYNSDQIELRVDANGAFTTEDVMEKLSRLAELDLHSIEQPLHAGQLNASSILATTSPLPIALDEELIGYTTYEDKQALLDKIKPQYIVLKPTLHGGIYGCQEWIEIADQMGIGWWVTSAMESNIGLNSIAQWCATLNNPLPQGLGTGLLFTDNVEMPLQIDGDMLWFDKK